MCVCNISAVMVYQEKWSRQISFLEPRKKTNLPHPVNYYPSNEIGTKLGLKPRKLIKIASSKTQIPLARGNMIRTYQIMELPVKTYEYQNGGKVC